MNLILTLLGILGIFLIWQAVTAKAVPQLPKIQRQRELQIDWPELVDDIHSAIRAGLSLPQAFVQLQTVAPKVLDPAFTKAFARYRTTGDFRAALQVFADELANPISDNFAAALILASDLGGSDLGLVLRALSGTLRAQLALTDEIKARQSWTVNGAKLAVAAPWITVALLSTRAEARAIYFSSDGIRLLEICLITSALAYFLMIKIGKLPKQERLLVSR